MYEMRRKLPTLHTTMVFLPTLRRALSGATGSLSKSMAVLSSCEENSEMSAAMASLSAVEEKVRKVEHENPGLLCPGERVRFRAASGLKLVYYWHETFPRGT